MKYLLPAVLFLLMGCSVRDKVQDAVDDYLREPDLSPVKNVLSAAMPLAYAANLTMAAMKGAPPPNVTVIGGGPDTGTGCFLIHIAVDNTFPLPGNLQASGHIVTAGLNVDNRVMLMTAVFTNLSFSSGTFSIRDISTFPAVLDSNIITGEERLMVVYADIDVNSGSDTLLTTRMSQGQIDAECRKYEKIDSAISVEENAWIISVDDNGTISNASDDKYTINGGGQYVEISDGNAEVVQMTMFTTVMSPQCTYNPGEGYAFWQNLGVGGTASTPEIGHVFLTFHSACDGKAKITVATGVYAKSFGNNMDLGLAQ